MARSEGVWVAEPMEQQFPHLTHLDLIGEQKIHPDDVPYIHLDRFLGGSAPSLQHLRVDEFEYGGLPSLLVSAPNLVSLQIKNIRLPHYTPPEVMVGALTGLTKLRDLCIEFSNWLLTHPPPPALVRTVFPELIKFQIRDRNEYLNGLVALIDVPRLEDLSVESTKRYPNFDTGPTIVGQLSQFISRTPTFKHAQFRHAELTLRHRITQDRRRRERML